MNDFARMPDGQKMEGRRLAFTALAEHWTEVSVEDGTTLRVKTVISAVYRTDIVNANGKPNYMVSSINVVDVDVPEDLYGPPPGTESER